jgi:DNA-binding MarR family transcriptional regulator
MDVCAKTSVCAIFASTLLFAPMHTTGVSSEQLADQIARFLTAAMRTAQTEVFQVVAELELSMTQLKILHILDGSEHELTPSELAQFVGLSPAATGRAVDAMVRAGIVSRRDDDSDRRVKRLALTAVGAEAMARINAARLQGLTRIVQNLAPDERAALSAALTPLLLNAPQSPDCASPRAEDPA